MFNNYETLKCEKCKQTYVGRKGGEDICYECSNKNVLPLIEKSDRVTKEVIFETKDGRDEEDE